MLPSHVTYKKSEFKSALIIKLKYNCKFIS